MFKRRNPAEPAGIVSTVLETVLGLFLGAFIAVAWLIFKPVTVTDVVPAPGKGPVERHAVVYVSGKQVSGKSPQWSAKQRAFIDRAPGEIVLAEEDVNRWITSTFQSLDLSKKWESYSTEMKPTLPTVRIVGSELEIGIVTEVVFMGNKRKFVAQARGVFEKRDGREVFVPHKMYLGSCPLPSGQANWLYNSIADKFVVPDDAKLAWAAVQSAKIEQDRLKLTIAASGG